ncbi:MAG TPA: DNA-processing protein DprA [Thermoanaerobaculia bacterium]|nr:DNA-processing protein DprA [Thermoanaerobaculia bacterium]
MDIVPDRVRDQMIALSLLPSLSPSRTRKLLENFDPLDRLDHAAPEEISALLHVDQACARELLSAFQSATHSGVVAALRDSVITLADKEYPALLREIPDPPLTLNVVGDRTLLATRAIAIVGSRRASPYALNVAARLTEELARAGVTIVSGLARGVDAAAHQEALDTFGRTIAVIGTGIDLIYPRSHRQLSRQIEERGLIVSEFPAGTPPLPSNFPIRNRIISGLTLGTLIIEATGRSGSLITARMASEQGREVFAVPGSIFSGGSEGVHRLIQSGAKLVHDVEDIFEELPQLRKEQVTRVPRTRLEPELQRLLELIRCDEPVGADAIATKLNVPVNELAETLLTLEVRGLVMVLPGARYLRRA